MQKEMRAMKTNEFEAICGWIMNPPFVTEPSLMSSLMCVFLGIDRGKADNLFYREMGMSCEEAIEAVQKGIRRF